MAENGFLVGFVKRGKNSVDITQHLNIWNAKLLAIVLVLCLSACNVILRHDEDSCEWLLSRGSYRGEDAWQPYGCMMHTYSSGDLGRCYQNTGYPDKEYNHWVFIGDSRIRQLYFEVLKRVNSKAEPWIVKTDTAPNYTEFVQYELSNLNEEIEVTEEDARPLEKAHKSLTYNSTNLSLRITFFWRPVLNSSVVELLNNLKSMKSLPKLIVTGSGSWDIKLSKGSEQHVQEYGGNLAKVVECLDHWPSNSTTILWKFQDPVDETKLSDGRRMITNELIEQYNYAAEQVLRGSRFHAWRSARLTTENIPTQDDGLHTGQLPLKHQAQMLFNAYCNPRIEVRDGTCCRPSEPITALQILTFAVLLACSAIGASLAIHRHVRRARQQRVAFKPSENESTEPLVALPDAKPGKQLTPPDAGKASAAAKPILTTKDEPGWRDAVIALGKLGLIMAYFYLCDRTTFFMKENKHYSHLSFWLPVAYVFTLGLFFNEESRSTRVLHRDQTDEWKGWMQLVILIYHITGASQVLPLYMQMRILVSSYLFLTGYGHLCFFWNGGSASLVRLCQVLFRMNLMTVVICFCMNRPYQSYYFVPLVSFWYLVVYIVLAVPPKVSSAICDAKPVAYMYVVLKFVGLFAGISVLHLSQVFFESVFLLRPWKGLFVTRDDSIHEWWFRWSLDRYSICYGMVFGFVYVNAQKHGLIDDSTRQNLLSRPRTLLPVVVAALLGFFGYTAFTLTCLNKPECNAVHSYTAFVPIVSYVVLRNVFGSLRVRYSSFFAWFGRISLELFIGQYHIWLAADTHGVLVLVPGYPALNLLVTTFVLVCAAHEVHAVTGRLAAVAVPADWKRTLRNLLLFFLALVPVAVHTGAL